MNFNVSERINSPKNFSARQEAPMYQGYPRLSNRFGENTDNFCLDIPVIVTILAIFGMCLTVVDDEKERIADGVIDEGNGVFVDHA